MTFLISIALFNVAVPLQHSSIMLQIHRDMAGLPDYLEMENVIQNHRIVLDANDSRSRIEPFKKEWINKYQDALDDLSRRLRSFDRYPRQDIEAAFRALSKGPGGMLTPPYPDSENLADAPKPLEVANFGLVLLDRYLFDTPKSYKLKDRNQPWPNAIWSQAPFKEKSIDLLFPFQSIHSDGSVEMVSNIPFPEGFHPRYDP